LILSGWRACRNRSAAQAVVGAACAALMLASKETALLHFFALAAAAILFWRWNLHGKNLPVYGGSKRRWPRLLFFFY